MTVPMISPLPTPPSMLDSPETFVARADAFLGTGLPTLRTDANAQALYLEGRVQDAEQARQDALTYRNQANNAASAATTNGQTQVNIAAGHATAAAQQASNAASSANHAANMAASAQATAAAVGNTAGLPALTGNQRKVLAVNASATGVEFVDNMQTYYAEITSAQTWTKQVSCRWFEVECIGAGASGSASIYHTSAYEAGGGGGGGYNRKLFRAQDLPATVACVVGAGAIGTVVVRAVEDGAAGVLDTGSDGGNTSFGAFLKAYGGQGGGSNKVGGASGSGARQGHISPDGSPGGGTASSSGAGFFIAAATPPLTRNGGAGGGMGVPASASTPRVTPGGESLNAGNGGDGHGFIATGLSAGDGEFPGGGGGGAHLRIVGPGTTTSGKGANGIIRIKGW